MLVPFSLAGELHFSVHKMYKLVEGVAAIAAASSGNRCNRTYVETIKSSTRSTPLSVCWRQSNQITG